MKKSKVLHPGWGCCDLSQDLQGWLDREQAAVNILRRWCAVLHARGRRLDNLALNNLIEGNQAQYYKLQTECITAHGQANAYGQEALIRIGHVDRVREAHLWRL